MTMDIDYGPLYETTLALLQEMIRNACVNDLTDDGGDERANADTLERFFANTNVQVQRFEPHPNRVSVAFTIPGSDPAAEPLTLMGHTDVVPVEEEKWTKPPFGAEIHDGKLYGRGAMDMLFITAAMAAVTRELALSGQHPAGTLTFVGLADEEARGGLGAQWLYENRPDAFSWQNCLSESGGEHIRPIDGSDAVLITVGEKGSAQRRLTVHGGTGHGSAPWGVESSIAKLAEVIRRIHEYEPPVTDNSVWAEYVQAFHFDPETEKALISGTGDYQNFGDLAGVSHAISHATFALTKAYSGDAINILPSTAWVELDIRVLPGQSQDYVDELLRDALGDLAPEVEFTRLRRGPASESPASGALWEAMVDTVHDFFPAATVVPTFCTGGTDLRFSRYLSGTAYGFALHSPKRSAAELHKEMHSHDEAIYLEDIALTVGAYKQLVQRFLKVQF
ncbi:M20/M25/M40 family metallo-hydrolase [Corynebacterium caspium]|uniref:M20/M25/M40 family metallo-hydrolase n=1 Tax=Corynebacterium caspium TaxID=234828 RepID=UPI0003611C2D